MQTQITASSPGLFKYYGSINTLQSYYNGEVRRELEAKYGNDIYDRYYAYLDELDPAKKKQMKTPDLKAFMDEKGKKKDPINRAIVEMMNKLPNRPEYAQRADLTDPSAAQQSIINTLNAGTSVDPQMLWANTSPALQELVGNYWMNGGELSYAARGNLDFVAEQFGISGDEALQLMGVMITQQ